MVPGKTSLFFPLVAKKWKIDLFINQTTVKQLSRAVNPSRNVVPAALALSRVLCEELHEECVFPLCSERINRAMNRASPCFSLYVLLGKVLFIKQAL